MQTFTLTTLQRLIIAIRDGADTIDKLKIATGHGYNLVRNAVKALEDSKYITRLYTTKNKRIPTLLLTDEGEALASADTANLHYMTTGETWHDAPSIMWRDHTQYYRWLHRLKAEARDVSKTQLA